MFDHKHLVWRGEGPLFYKTEMHKGCIHRKKKLIVFNILFIVLYMFSMLLRLYIVIFELSRSVLIESDVFNMNIVPIPLPAKKKS